MLSTGAELVGVVPCADVTGLDPGVAGRGHRPRSVHPPMLPPPGRPANRITGRFHPGQGMRSPPVHVKISHAGRVDREQRNLGRPSATHLVSAARRRMRRRQCTLTMWKPHPRPGYGVRGPSGCRACWRSSGLDSLIFGDVIVTLASLLNDNAEPQTGWVYPAVIGHCVLAAASVLALRVGLKSPARRRAAAITAWMIIPVGIGWAALTARLLGAS